MTKKQSNEVVPGCEAGMSVSTLRRWVLHIYRERKAGQVRKHVHSCDPCARRSAEIYGFTEMVIDVMRWHDAMQDKVLAYARKELPADQIPEVIEHLHTCGECVRLHASGVMVRSAGMLERSVHKNRRSK
jgi:hypothetical protein